MKNNSLKNKIATYALLGALTLPTQSFGSWYWPFGGDKREKQKQEQVKKETIRENTIKYLEKNGAKPLPKINIPEVMKSDSTLTNPMWNIYEVMKPYLKEEQEQYIEEELRNAEINYSNRRQVLVDVASSDSVNALTYGLFSTPRTDIFPEEELPITYDVYRSMVNKAQGGDTTAAKLAEKLRPYFSQLGNNSMAVNGVRRSLDEVISPIEEEANSHWYNNPLVYIPGSIGLATGTYFLGKKIAGGKGEKEKVYNVGDWENGTQ